MNTNLPEYKTSHIPLATYLKISGVAIVNVSCANHRATYTFSNVPRELIIEFNAGRATVEPARYASEMSHLTQTAKRLSEEL